MSNKENDRHHLIVSIDSGTQSSRAMVYEAETMVQKSMSSKFIHLPLTPHEGWSEHEVETIEAAVVEALKCALVSYPEDTYEVIGIGITNQRETIVAWDGETGELLNERTICWNDNRTAEEIHRIKQEWSEEQLDYVRDATGLMIASYYSASKMKWMIDNVPEIKEAIDRGTLKFGTIDSYIIYRLTNQQKHVTDVSNASRTLLFDIRKLKYDQKICDWFGIPISSLPEVQPSASLFGSIPQDLTTYKLRSRYQSLPAILSGVKISAVLGDQQAATVGHNLFSSGGTKLTFGSGGFLLMNCGRGPPSQLPKGCTMSPLFQVEGDELAHYCVEGSIAHAGMGISWLAQNHLTTVPEVDEFIKTTETSEGVTFISAFNGILSPWWNEDLRGCILGISLKTERRHIVRAFLESLAVQVCEILLKMESAGATPKQLHLDGGLSQSDGFSQMLSDFAGLKIHRPPNCEMTARGVALMAKIGCADKPMQQYSEMVAKLAEVGSAVVQQYNEKIETFQPSLRAVVHANTRKVISDWMKGHETMTQFYSVDRTTQ